MHFKCLLILNKYSNSSLRQLSDDKANSVSLSGEIKHWNYDICDKYEYD